MILKVKKSFINIILFYILFVFMWILFGWNQGNADYENYKFVYNYIGMNGSYGGVEIGFEQLCKISNWFNFTYNQFLIFYSLFGLLLLSSTIKYFKGNEFIILFLYFVFPYLLDIVQIRNFMAMCIVTYSLRYLYENKYLKFSLGVFIATLFHNTSIFYFVFLLIKIRNIKKLFCVIIFTIIIGSFMKTSIVSILSTIFTTKSYLVYLQGNTSIITKIITIVYLIINVLLIYIIYIKTYKKNYKFYEFILKINIVILLSYLFISLDMDFFRLFRNIFFLNYIFLDNVISRRIFKFSENKMLYCLVFILYFAATSYIFIYLNNVDKVVQPIFQLNSLFK